MNRTDAEKVAAIVRDAGGEIIGRTRLQKITYLLTVTGLEDGFSFIYKHFGPYSEKLAEATRYADLLDLVQETKKEATWGGLYSIYTVHEGPNPNVNRERLDIAAHAVDADAIALELTATALFLAAEGLNDPWEETKRRKPEKSEDGRLNRAKLLYQQLRAIETPNAWPEING